MCQSCRLMLTCRSGPYLALLMSRDWQWCKKLASWQLGCWDLSALVGYIFDPDLTYLTRWQAFCSEQQYWPWYIISKNWRQKHTCLTDLQIFHLPVQSESFMVLYTLARWDGYLVFSRMKIRSSIVWKIAPREPKFNLILTHQKEDYILVTAARHSGCRTHHSDIIL